MDGQPTPTARTDRDCGVAAGRRQHHELPDGAHVAERRGNAPVARGRELDLAIAASAILHDAVLWTLNHRDFADIPRLRQR